MRSSARVRAVVGHGRNRDSAFDPPLSSPPPQSLLIVPFHSRNLLKASTQSIPNARNQDFECCCFTVVSVFGFRRFKKSLMRTPKKRPT